MSRPRAADDFATIRARMDELRRERQVGAGEADGRSGKPVAGRGESDAERLRRRERLEGAPPPWVPTIFVRRRRG